MLTIIRLFSHHDDGFCNTIITLFAHDKSKLMLTIITDHDDGFCNTIITLFAHDKSKLILTIITDHYHIMMMVFAIRLSL